MGYFTWTVANRKKRRNRYGWYASTCKLQYGSYGAVITPDNERIETDCYDGYGHFGKYDVYDLVVEWNKDHMTEIFDGLEKRHPDGYWGSSLREIAEAYQAGDEELLQRLINDVGESEPYIKDEWKRNVGIAIACYEEDNDALPYPIKIVDVKRHASYDELPTSCSCQ